MSLPQHRSDAQRTYTKIIPTERFCRSTKTGAFGPLLSHTQSDLRRVLSAPVAIRLISDKINQCRNIRADTNRVETTHDASLTVNGSPFVSSGGMSRYQTFLS